MSAQGTNLETMSIFSPQLSERFDKLVTKYPAKRSALIPMLLYAQDEVGYLSDAVIAEVDALVARYPDAAKYTPGAIL